MFEEDGNAMHVQPSLPEVGIHGEDWLPVGGKLGLRGVFGSTVLQGQDLDGKQTAQKGGSIQGSEDALISRPCLLISA